MAGPDQDLPGLEQYASELLATLNQLNFVPFVSESVVAQQTNQNVHRDKEEAVVSRVERQPQPQQRASGSGKARRQIRGSLRLSKSEPDDVESDHAQSPLGGTRLSSSSTFTGSSGEVHESIHAWLEAENVDPWIRTAARHDSQLERELAALHERLHGASPLADIIDYVSTETVRQQFEAYRRMNPQGARALLKNAASSGKGGAPSSGAGYESTSRALSNDMNLPGDAPPAVTVAAQAAARAAARATAEAMARRPAPEIDSASLGMPGPHVDPQASYSAYLRMRRANLPYHSQDAVATATHQLPERSTSPDPQLPNSADAARVKSHYVRHYLPGNGSPTSAATPSPHVPHDMAHDRSQEIARVTDALEVFHRRRMQDLQQRLGNPGWFPALQGNAAHEDDSAGDGPEQLAELQGSDGATPAMVDPLAALKRAQLRAVHDKIGTQSGSGVSGSRSRARTGSEAPPVGAEPMSPEDFQRLRRKHVPSAKQSNDAAQRTNTPKERSTTDRDAARAAWIKRFRVTKEPTGGTSRETTVTGPVEPLDGGEARPPPAAEGTGQESPIDISERYRLMKLAAVREKLGSQLVPEEEPSRNLLEDIQLTKEELANRYRQRLRSPPPTQCADVPESTVHRNPPPLPQQPNSGPKVSCAPTKPTAVDDTRQEPTPVFAPAPKRRTDFASGQKSTRSATKPKSAPGGVAGNKGKVQLPSSYTDLPKQSTKAKRVNKHQKKENWPKAFLQTKN